MINYANGKIYTLRSYSRPDLIYVGSTVLMLKERLRHHKRDYKLYVEGKPNYMTSFKIIELGDFYIELHEKCPCNDREELHKREGEVIRELNCVNKRIAGRTKKEHYNENRDVLLEKKKQYYNENKELCAERDKQYREANKELYAERNKKYRVVNKEKIAEQRKQYREANKERIAEKRKQKYTCECGSVVGISDKVRHFKTKKHQKFINDNIDTRN